MEDLRPSMSLRTVNRIIDEAGEEAVREWLARGWSREFLDGDSPVVRRLIVLLDFSRVGDRAATVMHAVANDWEDVLEAADGAAAGFTPAFWRDAFACAQKAGSTRCVSWLLDRKGDALALVSDGGLEL